jgi:hypothetical protein
MTKSRFSFTTIFAEQHPAEWLWITSNPTFEFANSMRHAIERWGSLTDNQMAAVRRCLVGAKRRVAERAERETNAPVVNTDKLMAAFDHAKSKGLQRLKMRFEGFAISPAPMTGKNAGALYVKNGEDYLGKIAGGKFFASRDCTSETQTAIMRVMQDPSAEAIAYGQKTGNCSICGLLLTNEKSIGRGIGPICAAKYGF